MSPSLLKFPKFLSFCRFWIVGMIAETILFHGRPRYSYFPIATVTAFISTTNRSPKVWSVSRILQSGAISASEKRYGVLPHKFYAQLNGNNNSNKNDDDDYDDKSSVIEMARNELQPYFDFELDDWQLEGGGEILKGNNVVICAPTGAGKTVVGEMALIIAFCMQRKHAIYTTPLKALSNQKYSELCQKFSKSNVGLSTGDLSINKGAPLTVMTTEVYRNIAWRDSSSSSSSSSSNNNNDLDENAVVVLDEFHYMGHPGRGGVWEECIITSPSHTQIVGLSATLPNANQITKWMESVTERTTVLVSVSGTKPRPVPLRYMFATKDGLYPLFRDANAGPGSPNGLLGLRGDGVAIPTAELTANKNKKKQKRQKKRRGEDYDERVQVPATTSGTDDGEIISVGGTTKFPKGLGVNPKLQALAEKRLNKVDRAIQRQKVKQIFDNNDDDRRRGGQWMYQRRQKRRLSSPREEERERERLLRNEMRRAVPSLTILLNRLNQKQLLPAIFFIFSRAGCEEAAATVCRQMTSGSTGSGKNRREENNSDNDDFDNEFEKLLEEIDSSATQPKTQQQEQPKKNRKTRQRSDRYQQREKEESNKGGSFIEDDDGRIFRLSSNYLSENTLEALTQTAIDDATDSFFFDRDSPLSSQNWKFFSIVGLLQFSKVKEVATKISLFNEENPEIAFEESTMTQFLCGVGSHHAGMLPAHKSFVEVLYQNQLMKAVFATETLAAGINMPARTTVICSLAKRTGTPAANGGKSSSMKLLETADLLQMAGRAGRRGMDTEGTSVIVATAFENHDDAAKILTDPIKPIQSQFSPSYSLAINLISRGEGQLTVAKQLIQKSFAMWEKRQLENRVTTAVEQQRDSDGGGVEEFLKASSHERFMNVLMDALQVQIDKRRAKFDIQRVQSLLDVLKDREVLKKTSKSYLGSVRMLELEETTLGYLEKEYEALEATMADSTSLLGDVLDEDLTDMVTQIEIQRKRTTAKEKEVNKNPFTTIVSIANEIIKDQSPEGQILKSALRATRMVDDDFLNGDSIDIQIQSKDSPLTASELSTFSKSLVVMKRQTRKLSKANPNLDSASLLELKEAAQQQAHAQQQEKDDSWNDMLALTKVLLSYGCLEVDPPLSLAEQSCDDDDLNAILETRKFQITKAGENIGMLGFDNSLWCLVAMGGAWDVAGTSSKLDAFRSDTGSDWSWYGDDIGDDKNEEIGQKEEPMELSQKEANSLVSLLRSMTASELAGYVSCLISENNSRGGNSGYSVVESFQALTLTQQSVVQSSLQAMDRLTEVQKTFDMDENTHNCVLDLSTCGTVTAWADGCTWNEALEISGSAPGDLARILSRVLDAVRQLGNLPYIPVRRDDPASSCRGMDPQIRRLCRDAAAAISRYPVTDLLQFEMTEDDDDDVEDSKEEDGEELSLEEGEDKDDEEEGEEEEE